MRPAPRDVFGRSLVPGIAGTRVASAVKFLLRGAGEVARGGRISFFRMPPRKQRGGSGTRHFTASVLVGRVEPVGEAQAGGPVLAALEEIAGIHELAVGVFAGRRAGDRIVALTRSERRDLALAGHLEDVVIADAFGNDLT